MQARALLSMTTLHSSILPPAASNIPVVVTMLVGRFFNERFIQNNTAGIASSSTEDNPAGLTAATMVSAYALVR